MLIPGAEVVRAIDPFTPVRPGRLVAAGWLGLAVIAAAILYRFDPTTAGFFPSCPFHAATGLLCPGCGTTRALHHLLHGELLTSVRLSPLLPVAGPILGYALVSSGVLLVRGRGLPEPTITRFGGALLVGFLVVLWIVRNLPWWS
jgi:hypothetical protein